MSMTAKISEAAGAFQAELEAHPECRADFAAQAAIAGRPRRHVRRPKAAPIQGVTVNGK